MAKREKPCECERGVPLWMVTYGDMVTLLLTFFVMLFTVARIEDREFRLILSAFKGSLGLFEGGQTLSKGKLEEMGMNLESLPATEKGTNLSKALKDDSQVFEPDVKTKRVRLTFEERGMVISLIGDGNFAPGSAELNSQVIKLLQKVGFLMRQYDAFFRIEGHADRDRVDRGRQYDTNWELASQRAINVLRYLAEKQDIESYKMSATSYGKFRPIAKSSTPEGQSINRRVDIVILTGKAAKRKYKDSALPLNKIPGTETEFKN